MKQQTWEKEFDKYTTEFKCPFCDSELYLRASKTKYLRDFIRHLIAQEKERWEKNIENKTEKLFRKVIKIPIKGVIKDKKIKWYD